MYFLAEVAFWQGFFEASFVTSFLYSSYLFRLIYLCTHCNSGQILLLTMRIGIFPAYDPRVDSPVFPRAMCWL